MIKSVKICIPLHGLGICFGPNKIQIQIGNSKDANDTFHYKSKDFDIDLSVSRILEFQIWPDIAIGNFLKVVLLDRSR